MGAKSNRTYIASVSESTWGTTPATPTMQKINNVEDSLNYEISTTTPETKRDDRMTPDVIQVSGGNVGGYSLEMQALASGAEDPHLLGALWAEEWIGESSKTLATGVVITAASRTIDLTALAGTLETLAIGQKFILNGSAESNDGIYTVESVTSTDVYVTSEAFVGDETMPALSYFFFTEYARNGVSQHSFTLERGHTDVEEYFTYTGMVVDELSLSIEAGAVITGEYTFVGKEAVQAPITGATYLAQTLNDFMSAGFSVESVMINGVAVDECLLMSLEINIKNGVSGKLAVGSTGFCNVSEGGFELNGAINLYFNNSTMYSRFIDNTAFSISFAMSDDSENYYIITLPRVKLKKHELSSSDNDVMDDGEYEALIDETTNCMIQVDRVIA